jgi:hypothetical protein
MKTIEEITLDEWRRLYELAISLKELKPWGWMWDGDLFGVEDPETGEIGYCCVMGRGGEHYALAIYRGSEGLAGYLKVRTGKVNASSLDAQHCQDCLMLSFEDRDYLPPEDLRLIKRLGLTFRGANAWPLFRDWEPGYFPWFITPPQARYLLRVLPPVLEMTERIRVDPRLLEPPEPGRYLVLVSRPSPDGPAWQPEWKSPARMPEPEDEADCAPDPVRLEKIRQFPLLQDGTWEIDYFYGPTPVREKASRPYYPPMLLAVDQETGVIIFFHMTGFAPDWKRKLLEAFWNRLAETKQLPKKILVRERGYILLEGTAAALGIKLVWMDDLPGVNEAREYFRVCSEGR